MGCGYTTECRVWSTSPFPWQLRVEAQEPPNSRLPIPPSIFDREDEASPRPGSLAALEKRQAEKKKELMKAQSLPKTSASQARKAMIEKLEKEGASG